MFVSFFPSLPEPLCHFNLPRGGRFATSYVFSRHPMFLERLTGGKELGERTVFSGMQYLSFLRGGGDFVPEVSMLGG